MDDPIRLEPRESRYPQSVRVTKSLTALRPTLLARGKACYSDRSSGGFFSITNGLIGGPVKHFLKRHLPTFARLLADLRAGRFELFPPRLTYAQGSFHRNIKLLLNYRGGVYFEVGANDGLRQSNTAYLEKHMNWRGFLVEPIPTLFAECARNRPESVVINAALVSKDFSEPFIDVYFSDLMSITGDAKQNLLNREDHLEAGRRFLSVDARLSGHRFVAPATTVSKLLDDHGADRIDFFSLDVEGYELEVLKGIDFDRHRPRYFLIEARDADAVRDFLWNKGYRHSAQWSKHDHLFEDFPRGSLHTVA